MLCGKNLFIQRRAHTTINLPGKGQAKQWAHYELMSGISPYSFVMWAPLHDLEDEGGVYYIDQKSSSNSAEIKFIFFILINLDTITVQDQTEANIRIMITDLTTQSALKKSFHIEKSVAPPKPTT